MTYLHAHQPRPVLHNDLKSANTMIDASFRAKIADFGLSSKRYVQGMAGTPFWMAPEVIEMSGSSSACDVWSVGCTVIELLTGKPPYFDLPAMSALFHIVQARRGARLSEEGEAARRRRVVGTRPRPKHAAPLTWRAAGAAVTDAKLHLAPPEAAEGGKPLP